MIYGFNAGEVFRIALEIEENGRLFYEKAQARTDDPDVRGVFQELGAEEVKHKERFAQILSELPPSTTGSTVWDPAGEIDQYLKMMADMHVFHLGADIGALVAQAGTAAEALKLAIQFEKDSIIFFAEMQNLAENEEGRQTMGILVREEQAHLRKLSAALTRIKG